MKIKAGSVNKGIFLKWKDRAVLVVDKEFFNPGKGRAVIRLKIKDVQTGRVLKHTLLTDEIVEKIAVEYRRAQFLYAADKQLVFADPVSFEQWEIPAPLIGNDLVFLKEGQIYRICFYNQEALGVIIPKKMTLSITQTEAGAKGNTVSGATKNATLEAGLVIKVPLFVKQGEKVIVNTEKRTYLKRV